MNEASSTRRVLIADDDEAVRNFLALVIEGAGYLVSTAADGNQAIAQMLTQPADLVITDLFMPEKEGIETILVLKREHPHVKVVAISGAVSEQLLNAAQHLGADRVLSKPIQPKLLVETVKGLIG